MSRVKLNLDTWPRRDHYHFFRGFEEPYFGVTVDLECGPAYRHAKSSGLSFFLYYLYLSLKAANETEPFRYRIQGDDVWVYEQVHASPTINRADGSFGFAYMNYHADAAAFFRQGRAEMERLRASTGLVPAVSGENVIHYSSLPWIRFRSISHARSFSFKDSIPKISFGKLTEENGKQLMPVSVHVHHALMDGYHVSEYLDRFQQYLLQNG